MVRRAEKSSFFARGFLRNLDPYILLVVLLRWTGSELTVQVIVVVNGVIVSSAAANVLVKRSRVDVRNAWCS